MPCETGFSFDLNHEKTWWVGERVVVTTLKQIMIILVILFTGDWIFQWFFKDWRKMHFYNLALILPSHISSSSSATF